MEIKKGRRNQLFFLKLTTCQFHNNNNLVGRMTKINPMMVALLPTGPSLLNFSTKMKKMNTRNHPILPLQWETFSLDQHTALFMNFVVLLPTTDLDLKRVVGGLKCTFASSSIKMRTATKQTLSQNQKNHRPSKKPGIILIPSSRRNGMRLFALSFAKCSRT